MSNATCPATPQPDAMSAYGRAVRAVLAHRPEAGPALAEALAADPDMVAAHALRGLAGILLGRRETVQGAPAALAEARRAAAQRGAGPADLALVEALALASDGDLLAAAARLEGHLRASPHDVLALKLAHSLRFMAGDQAGMLAATRRLLPAWSTDVPGFGFVLGCHAFALEEAGLYDDAEEMGREAVAREPEDAWGLHAVSHVYEMENRVAEGVGWLEQTRPTWTGCNNFSFHVAWHLALFHVEAGQPARALALYDREIRPVPTDDFRDMANAVSLLWRLRQDGVDAGHRWDELAETARKRRDDATLVFASLHYALALLAQGRTSAALDVATALSSRASEPGGQAAAAGRVGIDFVRIAAGLTRASRALVERLVRHMPEIGGSNAQRDVFLRTLATIAAQTGEPGALDAVLSARRRLKRDDRFARTVSERLRAAGAGLCVA